MESALTQVDTLKLHMRLFFFMMVSAGDTRLVEALLLEKSIAGFLYRKWNHICIIRLCSTSLFPPHITHHSLSYFLPSSCEVVVVNKLHVSFCHFEFDDRIYSSYVPFVFGRFPLGGGGGGGFYPSTKKPVWIKGVSRLTCTASNQIRKHFTILLITSAWSSIK